MEIRTATIEELIERKKTIAVEVEAEGADLDALGEEVRSINAEIETRKANEAKKVEIRKAVAEGNGKVITEKKEDKKMNPTEERANALAERGKYNIPTAEIRSTLVSSSTVATPTGVSGINDAVGNGGTLLDFIKVVDCSGMGANRVAYIATEAEYAADQTEGSAAAAKEATFGYIDITPANVAMYAQISKQVKKQSPLMYEQKVTEQSMKSIKKAVIKKVATAMNDSTLISTITATTSAGKGVINEKTLRSLVLSYGGDNAVEGNAMLFLNKTDLIAFGDVRGTNEKKGVYEIEPDGSNPNTGIIRDGGLAVRYCLCNELTACAGTAAGVTDKLTMFYGNPQNVELDMFSPLEVKVSEDFAFTSLMDTIVGDCEVGAAVVAKNGMVALKIAHT